MMSMLTTVLLVGAGAVLVLCPAVSGYDPKFDRPQKCISGASVGVCKRWSDCESSEKTSKTPTADGDYGCKDGMVCCTELHNQRCERLNGRTRLPDPAHGCCGIERFSAADLLKNDSLDDDRILNGSKSGLYQSPWLVRLLHIRGGVSTCSGVLVGERHVLSVRHCLEGVNGIRLGCPGNLSNPRHCKMHLKKDQLFRTYMHETLDFGILELAEAVPYTDLIRPICLPAEEVRTAGLELVVAGWGRTRANVTAGSRSKLYTQVPFVPLDECNAKLRAHNIDNTVTAVDICAGGDATGRDVCKGDSGGPLMRVVGARHELAGVVSGSLAAAEPVSCGEPGVPARYVNVFALRDWIDSKIGGQT